MSDRIANELLKGKVMSADEAAQFINNGDSVGMSGFTGAGYPKALPTAIANRAKEAHEKGEDYKINVYTGASTAPDCDGVMAEADAINYRMPYMGDPKLREAINTGRAKYQDIHLSHSPQYIEHGFLPINVAVIEVTRITEEGYLIPSSGVGNNVEFMDYADKIILEVNSWQSLDLEGMHDIYRIQKLPNRTPVPINQPGDRIGKPHMDIDLNKVVAVVETNSADRNSPFKAPDETSKQIAGHFLDFLDGEVQAGRLAYDGYVMQSGVGNVPNAVMSGLLDSKFENIKAYTEVIQDGMLDLIDAGKMTVASSTSFALSPEAAEKMNDQAAHYRKHIILRPQQISNHPEVVRRMGLIATNGMIEADIYGNINSTHIAGSKVMNGIGGSGDFTRNALISSFISPSMAKGDAISAVVPFASHIDHTEHDAMVIITERGVADLRGLAPRDRVKKMIAIANPEYQPLLEEYVEAANKGKALATPHDLSQAFAFHTRFLETGTMKKQ